MRAVEGRREQARGDRRRMPEEPSAVFRHRSTIINRLSARRLRCGPSVFLGRESDHESKNRSGEHDLEVVVFSGFAR